jgi:hypothetical protein
MIASPCRETDRRDDDRRAAFSRRQVKQILAMELCGASPTISA